MAKRKKKLYTKAYEVTASDGAYKALPGLIARAPQAKPTALDFM